MLDPPTVPVHTFLVPDLEWVGPQVEDLWRTQRRERIPPNRGAVSGLLGEDELPLVVAQPNELALVVEVEEFVARAGRLPGECISDVVAIKMNLEGLVADFHTLLELLLHVGHAGSGQQRREHVFVGEDVIEHSAGLDDAGPTNGRRHAVTAFPVGILLPAERRGAAIGPREFLRAVVGRIHLDGVTFEGGAPSKKVRAGLIDAIVQVYDAFKAYDARAIEVNPLILTKDQRILAADCHLTLDDNAVFRHPEIGIKVPRDMDREPTELEQKAWAIEEGDYRGTGYFSQMAPKIEGPGWLGFQGIGGGGAMLGATAFVARGFKIANYADTSGDPPASKIYIVLKHILSQEIEGYVLMGACLANQEQWHHAHALVKAFREEAKKRPGFPVIILLAGNKEKETHEIIKEGFKDLPLRWELYGREYIYNTDFIADRVEALVKAYKAEKE